MRARKMLLSGDIDGGDYRIIKSGSENKISVLSRSYLLWVIRGRILDAILNKAVIHYLTSILYVKMPVRLKKTEIISSIYPEKPVFDGFNYRTPRLNEAVRLIYNMDAAFEENKNGTNDNFFHLSHQVNPLVQNSNHLLEDLKLLSDLLAA